MTSLLSNTMGASGLLSRIASRAWLLLLLADAGIVLYGVMVVVEPSMLAAGFESATGSSWPALTAQSPDTASYLLWIYRLVGGLNVALGAALVAIAVWPFRRGERWARWSLLVGNALAYGVPMTFDQVTGAIGVFEILEFVAVAAVAAALALDAWAAARRPMPATWQTVPGGH